MSGIKNTFLHLTVYTAKPLPLFSISLWCHHGIGDTIMEQHKKVIYSPVYNK